jgi:large subunit ribosomal protein L18
MKRKAGNRKREKLLARKQRVARGLGVSDRTRLTVYRSARHIYAQLVDPGSGRTLASTSTRSKTVSGDGKSGGNVEAAKRVGKAIAELALQMQIEEVVFNRNGFLYHGRVKALAEAAREAGLRF